MNQAYPYASAAKIQETLALIDQPYVGQTTVPLLQQICIAMANRGGGGGDPLANTSAALGGVPLGLQEETLLKQLLVLAATT